MPLVRAIAAIAHHFFTATDPSRRAVLSQQLQLLLSQVTLTSLYIQPMEHQAEFYMVYESTVFSMCIFVMQKGIHMPVHDHPDMTVFSKVVHGDMHATTYETLAGVSPQPDRIPCRIHLDKVISGQSKDNLLIITPQSKANLHSFKAVSDFVVLLDIIGPPYDDDRACTFFQQREWSAFPDPRPDTALTSALKTQHQETNIKTIEKSKTSSCPNSPRHSSRNSRTKSTQSTLNISEPGDESTSSQDQERLCWLVRDPYTLYHSVHRPYMGLAVEIPAPETNGTETRAAIDTLSMARARSLPSSSTTTPEPMSISEPHPCPSTDPFNVQGSLQRPFKRLCILDKESMQKD